MHTTTVSRNESIVSALSGEETADGLPIVGVAELIATGVVLIAATASGAVLFSESSKGKQTFPDLLLTIGLPSMIVMAVALVASFTFNWRRLRSGILIGAAAGVVGTVGLEIVRHIGFRVFETMPGDLPRLMGIKATDRIMQGPSTWSDVVGYVDHFWNGAAFGITFALIAGGMPASRRWKLGGVVAATLYGLALGVGFALGPVPKSLGVGGPFATVTVAEFRATVYIAHIAFGVLLGLVMTAYNSRMRPIWSHLRRYS